MTGKNKKWIVAVMPQSMDLDDVKIFRLKDPGTGDIRDYGSMTTGIVEFQSISADFASFVVGRHIVKDGDLYLMNKVDPLFFYLSTQAVDSNKQQQSWQPFEQFIEQSKLPQVVYPLLSEKQLGHICATFCNDGVCYFKFSVEKTLKWLQRKQERVFESLVCQDQRKRKAEDKKYAPLCDNIPGTNNSRYMGGSISENFNLPQLDPATSPCKEDTNCNASPVATMSENLKAESIQIVCNYLNNSWKEKLTEHLGYKAGNILANNTKANNATGSNRNVQPVEPVDTQSDSNVPASEISALNKNAAPARTSGNKRLAKVNTKGMKTISCFFGGVKAKKVKH